MISQANDQYQTEKKEQTEPNTKLNIKTQKVISNEKFTTKIKYNAKQQQITFGIINSRNDLIRRKAVLNLQNISQSLFEAFQCQISPQLTSLLNLWKYLILKPSAIKIMSLESSYFFIRAKTDRLSMKQIFKVYFTDELPENINLNISEVQSNKQHEQQFSLSDFTAQNLNMTQTIPNPKQYRKVYSKKDPTKYQLYEIVYDYLPDNDDQNNSQCQKQVKNKQEKSKKQQGKSKSIKQQRQKEFKQERRIEKEFKEKKKKEIEKKNKQKASIKPKQRQKSKQSIKKLQIEEPKSTINQIKKFPNPKIKVISKSTQLSNIKQRQKRPLEFSQKIRNNRVQSVCNIKIKAVKPKVTTEQSVQASSQQIDRIQNSLILINQYQQGSEEGQMVFKQVKKDEFELLKFKTEKQQNRIQQVEPKNQTESIEQGEGYQIHSESSKNQQEEQQQQQGILSQLLQVVEKNKPSFLTQSTNHQVTKSNIQIKQQIRQQGPLINTYTHPQRHQSKMQAQTQERIINLSPIQKNPFQFSRDQKSLSATKDEIQVFTILPPIIPQRYQSQWEKQQFLEQLYQLQQKYDKSLIQHERRLLEKQQKQKQQISSKRSQQSKSHKQKRKHIKKERKNMRAINSSQDESNSSEERKRKKHKKKKHKKHRHSSSDSYNSSSDYRNYRRQPTSHYNRHQHKKFRQKGYERFDNLNSNSSQQRHKYKNPYQYYYKK